MEQIKCPQCGASVDPMAKACRYCGGPLPVVQEQPPERVVPPVQTAPPPYYAPPPYAQPPYAPPPYAPPPVVSDKSRVAAGVLALVLGTFGIHKFYLGKTGAGIVYLIFFWTGIPTFIGWIEGLIYLCSSDENFYRKYVSR